MCIRHRNFSPVGYKDYFDGGTNSEETNEKKKVSKQKKIISDLMVDDASFLISRVGSRNNGVLEG